MNLLNVIGEISEGKHDKQLSLLSGAIKDRLRELGGGSNGDDDEVGGSGLTIRDFKRGDKVRTGSNVHPTYIADQPGVVEEVRRTRILIKFDTPPVGTRFERGVVCRPQNLIKVPISFNQTPTTV